ncbi:CsbD family protein [Nitrospira sp. KM1]|uniref:CsbD family protein n=1 Tax=Nitrospira sp. KM1 TaxID=1936990 RepID=UPI001E40D9AA
MKANSTYSKPNLNSIVAGIVLVCATVPIGLISGTMAGSSNSIERGIAVPIVNQDQLTGKWKQFKGELKKKWGAFTDDDLLEIEGSSDKLEGKIQERYGDRREEVKDWVDQWFDSHASDGKKSKS